MSIDHPNVVCCWAFAHPPPCCSTINIWLPLLPAVPCGGGGAALPPYLEPDERLQRIVNKVLSRAALHLTQVPCHEVFLSRTSQLCFVLELCRFGDVSSYLRKAKHLKTAFPEECIWRLFLQMCL